MQNESKPFHLVTHRVLEKILGKLYFLVKEDLSYSKNLLANLTNLELDERPSNINTQEIIKRIERAYRKAKEHPYSIGGTWTNIISENMKVIDDGGRLKGLLENFFRNECSYGLITHATYESLSKYSKKEKKQFIMRILKDIEIWNDLVEGHQLEELQTPMIGNPWGYRLQDILILPDSARHHYCACRAQNLLNEFKKPVIAEIGGGYGGFAYYLLKNKSYKYINFDIPEVLLLSQYYLMCAFPEKKFLLYGEGDLNSDYDVVLMPHFEIPKLSNDSIDLFINFHSLSEMDSSISKDYLSHIVRTCRKYFFHVNSDKSVLSFSNHREIPASQFQIPNFKQIHKYHSLFGGGGGRYREYLYERMLA